MAFREWALMIVAERGTGSRMLLGRLKGEGGGDEAHRFLLSNPLCGGDDVEFDEVVVL